jgi:ubiquitin-protein ligase
MNPQLRRLNADYQKIKSVFGNHPFVQLIKEEGNPPNKYTFEFMVQGLIPDDEKTFTRGDTHLAEVFLPMEYPRRPPFCRMITPVFHPNIDPQKICIGDHWSAGESLAHLIVRIGEMICYQSYNFKSPLNGKAAAWAEQNIDQLPIQQDDLTVGL